MAADASGERRLRIPSVGEPAPWFVARSAVNPVFHFDTVAGRYSVLCFFGFAEDPSARAVLEWVSQESALFDDANVAFFGVSADPDDERKARVADRVPGIRFFWDFDRAISRLYGLALEGPSGPVKQVTFVLDPMLRILAVIPFTGGAGRHNALLSQLLRGLPRIAAPSMAAVQAPILMIPRIFEPGLCRRLVEVFESHGGEDSGFMRDVNGKTVGLIDHTHKRRTDCVIEDEPLKHACMIRIHDRLVPPIEQAFQFRATRMKRYIVACYDSAWKGCFRPHRDNTTKGTAHRRFAVTINLNTSEYEGGCLRFPEYGPQLYEVPVGGGLVFSCALLHEATPVTRGKRYAFLPFLYDDAAADVRLVNRRFLATDTRAYARNNSEDKSVQAARS